MFINAGPLMGILMSYRIVWIGGRFGGYKTSLSYALARPYLRDGYRLVTNSRCIWADDISEISLSEYGHLRSIIILDEGGVFLKSSKQIEMAFSYAAKMDVMLLIPSYIPPPPAAQVIQVQPVFNFKSAGLPVVVYKWKVRIGSFKDEGTFLWVWPSAMYGIYSRQDPGSEPGEILAFLMGKIREYRQYHERTGEQLSTVVEDEAQDILVDVARQMAGVASEFETLSSRAGHRRRRGR